MSHKLKSLAARLTLANLSAIPNQYSPLRVSPVRQSGADVRCPLAVWKIRSSSVNDLRVALRVGRFSFGRVDSTLLCKVTR